MKHRSISTFRKLRPNVSRFQSDLPTERSCKKRSTVFNDPCETERRTRNNTRRRGESSIQRRTSGSALRVAPWTTRQSTSYRTLPSACAPEKVGCLRTVGKWHRKVANKQIAREEKAGNTHQKHYTSYAVRVLLCPSRHGVFANSPPCWGSVLSTSATFAQNLWRKSQNSTDFAQNQWSFFCPSATWRQSLRCAGQK